MATVTGSKRHLDITSDTLTTSSNVDVGAKLFITTTDTNTTSTSALVLNSTEVETRTLGSLAFSSATYDNYVSWNLKTNDTQRTTVGSGGDLNIVAGTNVGVAYSAGGTVTISSTDTTYSAGTLLDLSSTTFNVDLTELSNNTATFAPTQDHFVILDNGVQGKKLASSIFGSAAYEASSAFATASHTHGGVYVPEYEALQPSGSDREMNVWRKTHAVYSDDGSAATYFVIQTEVPQDNYSMGGFTLVYQDDYNSSGEGGEIRIYGYWNPESNSGFNGFRYECSNPYHTPTIEVCRNSSSGNTAFFISGEGGNYTQLIAKDLWLGYSASSATQQWGNGWVISQANNKDGYANFDTLNRNDFAAITTNGSTPSLTGGVSAAEVRTLIGAPSTSVATTSANGLMSSTDKSKLDGIESGAEVNVQADWNETTTTSDAYINNKPTLGTAAASAATDFISATNADTAAELITFSKGISTDGHSKFYNWRALNNSSNSGNSYWKIAEISGADQSSRFIVTLAGRSTSYSDNALPAMGHIVGQLNNDNNWDLVFYNHSTASSEVVTEVAIVDDGTLGVELWIKTGNYAEITASGHISDGSFTVVSNVASDGFTESPDGYTVITEYTVMNTGNSDVLYKSGGTMSGDILLGTNSIAADTTSPTAHIQVGAGTTNTSNRSDVALLGEASSGAVVNALGLINTATGGNSNGVALNFHNGDGWSPTGQIIVQQDSTGTATNSAMKFYTFAGGLNHRMSIKSDGTIRFNAYGAGLIASDANGNLSVDTNTYLTGIAANSVGIAELNVSDGSEGQVLTTDGNGTLSFSTVSAGGSNYYLDGITRTSGTNTLVFSVSGATNQSYTFGANAFTSYTDHSTQGYLTEETYTAHEDTSNLSGTYGSTANGTKIDEITVDANGHITAITTGATGNMTGFFVEDGDGTEVQINNSNEWKFVEGGGIDINWSDTSTGSDADPYDLTFTLDSDLRGDVVYIGGNANNYIQFDTTNNRIDFYAGGTFVARMESDGDLHIKGDVIAFSDIFG